MKKTFSVIMAIIMLAILPFESFAQASANKNLNRGTQVQIRLSSTIESDSTNSVINGVVDQDVYTADGRSIAISAGTPVTIQGNVQENGSCGKAGKITINSATTYTIDNKPVNLTLNYVKKGGGKGGLAWAIAILFFPIGLAGLLIKGGNATIESGTVFTATVSNNVTLD